MNERIFDESGKLIGFRGTCGCGATFAGGVYSARRELCDSCKKINRKFSQRKYYKKNPHRKEPEKKIINLPKTKPGMCEWCKVKKKPKGFAHFCRQCYRKLGELPENSCMP